MKNERPQGKGKRKRQWIPRVMSLIPPNKVFGSIKDYDRKDERNEIDLELEELDFEFEEDLYG